MAKIAFEAGDRIVCDADGKRGVGLVLPDMTVLIISGEGGRSGYTVIKTDIPSGASLLYSQYEFSHEIIFALDCVAKSHDINISTAKF